MVNEDYLNGDDSRQLKNGGSGGGGGGVFSSLQL